MTHVCRTIMVLCSLSGLIVMMYPEQLQLLLLVNLIFNCVANFLVINNGPMLLICADSYVVS